MSDRIRLMDAVNKKYAERHKNEPQGITGVEIHVPNEGTLHEKTFRRTPPSDCPCGGNKVINDIRDIQAAMKEANLAVGMVTPNNHHFSMFRAATSTDPKEQARAKERLLETFEIATKLKARTVVLWNGAEVYTNPFDPDFPGLFASYLKVLKTAAELAVKKDMYIAVEPKPFEPGDEMFPNNSGYLIALVADAAMKGYFSKAEYGRIGVNDEIGHVVMANCDLAQNYELHRFMGKNFHAHLNRQHARGKHDTDNELQMNLDTLAVVNALAQDPVFMSSKVRRFAGFDYQWRHFYSGSQGLLSLYASILRGRALERVSAELAEDTKLVALRQGHRYAELDAHVNRMLMEAAAPVEKEIETVGKEGIKVPADLKKRVDWIAY